MWLIGLIAAGALIVGLVLAAALIEPPWLLDTGGLGAADRVKARNDFRGTMLTALGGLAVIVGAVVGGLNLRETSRQNRAVLQHTRDVLDLQRRGQVTERFAKAIEQLGSEKLDLRIGAAFALEQIARDSPELHWPIMEVLTAYLREHTQGATAESRDEVRRRESAKGAHDRTPADIQSVATVIGYRNHGQDPVDQYLDLRGVDLRYVRWAGARLEEADLGGAHLEEAMLSEAHLT